jgi:hypothetical protein
VTLQSWRFYNRARVWRNAYQKIASIPDRRIGSSFGQGLSRSNRLRPIGKKGSDSKV